MCYILDHTLKLRNESIIMIKFIEEILKKLHWLKIQDIIIYKMLMITYKSYYNMAPPYLYELINKKEIHVNTRLGTDHYQLIIANLVRIVLTLSLSVHSFMLLHANGTYQNIKF